MSSSSGEDPFISYYSSKLGLCLQNEDGNEFTRLYDIFATDLTDEEVQDLKEKARKDSLIKKKLLETKIKWLSSMEPKVLERERLAAVEKKDDLKKAAADPLSLCQGDVQRDDKPALSEIDVPYADDGVGSDSGVSGEGRYLTDYAGCGDYVNKPTTKSLDAQASALENYNQRRGDPVAIPIGDYDSTYIRNYNTIGSYKSGWTLTGSYEEEETASQQKKNSTDESEGALANQGKKIKKKRKKQKRTVNGEGLLNTDESKERSGANRTATSVAGKEYSAAYKRNMRRRMQNKNNKAASDTTEDAACKSSTTLIPVNSTSVGTTTALQQQEQQQQRPKKRSVKQFKEQKAREQNSTVHRLQAPTDAQNDFFSPSTYHHHEAGPAKHEAKQAAIYSHHKQEEEKKNKKEIQDFLSEQKINDIVKSIEDVPSTGAGDKKSRFSNASNKLGGSQKQNKKKAKKVKKSAVPDVKKAVVVVAAAEKRKESNDEGNSDGPVDDDDDILPHSAPVLNVGDPRPISPMIVQKSKRLDTVLDNDEAEDRDGCFTVQRRSKKSNSRNNHNNYQSNQDLATPSKHHHQQQQQRSKRRYSDAKTDEDEQHMSSMKSNNHHYGATTSSSSNYYSGHKSQQQQQVATKNQRGVGKDAPADLSNENNWPKLAAAASNVMSFASCSSSNHASTSYASKLKANLDSVGCSPASSGEDGNSSTSSSGGNISANHATFPASTVATTSGANVSTSPNVEMDLYNHQHHPNINQTVASAARKLSKGANITAKVGDDEPETALKSENQPLLQKKDNEPAASSSVAEPTKVASSVVKQQTSDLITVQKIADEKKAETSMTDDAVLNEAAAAPVAVVVKKIDDQKAASTSVASGDAALKNAAAAPKTPTKPAAKKFQKKSTSKKKKESEADEPVKFANDVTTIVDNNMNLSFFYDESTSPSSSSSSSSSNALINGITSGQACDSSEQKDGDEREQQQPEAAIPCETFIVADAVVATKDEEEARQASNPVERPIVLPQPKFSQRMGPGLSVTSPLNDPGNFDVIAAGNFFKKLFLESAKVATYYSPDLFKDGKDDDGSSSKKNN